MLDLSNCIFDSSWTMFVSHFKSAFEKYLFCLLQINFFLAFPDRFDVLMLKMVFLK